MVSVVKHCSIWLSTSILLQALAKDLSRTFEVKLRLVGFHLWLYMQPNDFVLIAQPLTLTGGYGGGGYGGEQSLIIVIASQQLA